MELDTGFTLKLIDFGSAQKQKYDEHHQAMKPFQFESNARIGKPAFCSPQIFNRETFNGKAADCWSFWCFNVCIVCWRISVEKSQILTKVNCFKPLCWITI
eukprot:TRINITY_DN6053_c0_g1_i1.p1 TRINITY_DN6053_c0_g1~~TRINITY_DN6053_c0_g1_i1.p1  ORF type:complete len:101 (+),score=4.39 TRINITY_DN6053_c0_g1_i1:261-563(+)